MQLHNDCSNYETVFRRLRFEFPCLIAQQNQENIKKSQKNYQYAIKTNQ